MISDIKLIFGTPVHENLEIHYTRSWELIRNFEEIRFSGFLSVEFWGYEGYLIFDTGKLVQGFEFQKDQEQQGIKALLNILSQLKRREGSISSYKMDPEWIPLMLIVMQSRAIRSEENLSGEALKTLVEEALKEIDHGFIKIQYGEDEAVAHILILNGSIVGTLLLSKDGKMSRELGTGRLFPKIVRLMSKISTRVSLESSSVTESYAESHNFTDVFDLIQASELILELSSWMKEFFCGHMPKEAAAERIEKTWKESCKNTKLKKIQVLDDGIKGLEQIKLEDLKNLFKEFSNLIKPHMDELVAESSITDQLTRVFWQMNASKISKSRFSLFDSPE